MSYITTNSKYIERHDFFFTFEYLTLLLRQIFIEFSSIPDFSTLFVLCTYNKKGYNNNVLICSLKYYTYYIRVMSIL